MSDEESYSVGSISITISNSEIKYETEFSIPEIVFWLEMVKTAVLDGVKNPELIETQSE